jgi:hypothetical protein
MAQDDKDDDLVMVGDGVTEEDQPKVVTVEVDDEDGQEQLEAAAEDAQEDERVGAAEGEDDQKAADRRAERKTRRQRQKDARDRDQRELTFLRSRNEQVERQLGDLSRRQDATEQAGVDHRLAQLDGAIRSADDVYAKAITAGEGEDAAEAQRIRDNLRDQAGQLRQWKESQGTEQAGEVVGPDPALVERVREWHGRNDWFDFGRRDEDSAIAGAIDDMLIRDGYDPTSGDYYDELDKRIANRLPHRALAGNGADEDTTRSRGPKFRVGGQERPLRSNEVHISRDRREAMEEAGVWEDPKLRKKYLAQYAEWDRQNA